MGRPSISFIDAERVGTAIVIVGSIYWRALRVSYVWKDGSRYRLVKGDGR
jgi:hypothetical protein